MTRIPRIGLFTLIAALGACDEDPAPTDPPAPDAAAPDAAAPDAAAPDAAAPDAGDGFIPDPACDYIDGASGQTVLSCDGAWTVLQEMTSSRGDASCPPWILAGEQAFATFEEAARALACDTDCVYHPRYAALFVYCDARAEATTYVDAGGCPDLLHFESSAGGGWYASWEAFEAAHPCP